MDREQLIEKHFQKQLSDGEQRLFDQLMAEDPTFKEEVVFQEQVRRVAEEEDDAQFRELLSDFESDYAEKPSQKSYPKWLAAASIILLVGASYFFFPKGTETPQELFAEHFEPYRNVVHPIVRSSEQQDLKTAAFAAYEQGQYEEAIILFDELYENGQASYYLFYKANALIKLARAREAIPLLESHLKTQDILAEKSPWYLAMAYLKLEDKTNAKKWLEEVVKQQKYKAATAQELLGSLE